MLVYHELDLVYVTHALVKLVKNGIVFPRRKRLDAIVFLHLHHEVYPKVPSEIDFVYFLFDGYLVFIVYGQL